MNDVDICSVVEVSELYLTPSTDVCLLFSPESGVYNSLLLTKISRLLVLALDADIFKQVSEQDGVNVSIILGKVTEVINGINSHAYMPKVKADRAVVLLTTIALEQTPGEMSFVYSPICL